MASSIDITYVKKYNSAGLAVNSPLIVSKGDEKSFSVLAHQIDWRKTIFADIDISTQNGTTYTEKLLNTIEQYIKSEGINNLITTPNYVESDNTNISYTTNTTGIKVITSVNLSSTGNLSYSYSYIYDTHDSTGTAGAKVTFGKTDGSKTKVITNVKLDNNGSLTYTYIDLDYDKKHHSLDTGKYNSAGNKDISNTDTATSGIKVITGIDLSADGTLSYTYSYIYDPHNDHNSTGTLVTKTTQDIIGNISVNSDGTTSYSYMKLWGHL